MQLVDVTYQYSEIVIIMQLYSILNLADSVDLCRNTVSYVLSYVSSTYMQYS
jgi:hypothetical protein